MLNSETAARILGETWSSSSDARKINFFLFGVKSVNYDFNCTLFREVQTFIINTNRFSMATVWLFNYTLRVTLINFVCCLCLSDLCVSLITALLWAPLISLGAFGTNNGKYV